MQQGEGRWVLAFDASCGGCREISHTVGQACDGKLEVLPLAHPEVRQWREQRFGSQAPWAPTLIRVQDGDVLVWTGRAMAIPLVRMLGLRSTMRVVHALGQLRHPDNERSDEQAGGAVVGRKKFLQLGTGVAVAAGLIATGQLPAFAMSGPSPARAWVETNRSRLPQRYDDVVTYPISYRRAIFSELAPQSQRQLWLDHLSRYRAAHPQLSAEQTAVIDQATDIVATECTFDSEPARGSDLHRNVQELANRARQAFGDDEARALIATLGPAGDSTTSAAAPAGTLCACSDQCHDYCEGSRYCKYGGCDFTRSCCTFWQWVCNGFCVSQS